MLHKFTSGTSVVHLLKKYYIVIYMFLSLVFMILDQQNFFVMPFIKERLLNYNALVLDNFSEVQSKSNKVIRSVTDFVSLKEENDKLNQEKLILEKYYIQTKMLEEENHALRKLMYFIPDKKTEFLTSKVLGDINEPFVSSLMIQGGKKDGVDKGMIAVNEHGVVGRILEVGENFSRLMLINDLNSRIPVITEKSRERAIITGTSQHGLLKLLYLPDDSKAQVGEMVFTSGDGKTFPPNLVVGTISQMKNNEYYLTPAVNLSLIDYVILVKY